jgi:hypothetical protein
LNRVSIFNSPALTLRSIWFRLLAATCDCTFSDVNLLRAQAQLKEQLDLREQFASFAATIEQRLLHDKLKSVQQEVDRRKTLLDPSSELGQDASAFLSVIDEYLHQFQRRRRREILITGGICFLIAAFLLGIVVFEESERRARNAKAAEANAKAQQEAAEAKAKAEQ